MDLELDPCNSFSQCMAFGAHMRYAPAWIIAKGRNKFTITRKFAWVNEYLPKKYMHQRSRTQNLMHV